MDKQKNRVHSPLAAAGQAAADGTLVLSSVDEGALWTDLPCIAIVHNADDFPDPSKDPDVEHELVTAQVGATLTVTRAQENTTAKNHNTPGKLYRALRVPTERYFNQLELLIGSLEKVAFRARLSANQSFTGGAGFSKLLFSVEDKDLSGEYDAPNSRFLCGTKPVQLLVTARARFLAFNDGGDATIAIYKNGTIVSQKTQRAAAAGVLDCEHSDLIDVASTNTLEAYLSHGDGVAVRSAEADGKHTYFFGVAVGLWNRV